MDITSRESREAASNWANQIAELLTQKPDHSAATAVASVVEQFKDAKFQLAILGKAKRGKSTLINALLGRRDDLLAPIDKLPASSAITRFSWHDTERAVVNFRDGGQEAIPFLRIREFVTEEFNKENMKGVEVVDVSGPFVALDRDLILVDTPGAASIHEHHDALLHAFIPQADAVVFLMTARMPIDQDELELLAQVKEADIRKVFFAINKIDELSPDDLRDANAHNQRLLAQSGIHIEQIHEISAKRAFQGDLTESGLADLTADIAAFLAAHKGKILSERLASRVEAQATPVLHALDIAMASYSKTAEELDADLRDLREKKRSMESERTLAEREFTRAWTLAVDQFVEGVSSAKTEASAHIRNEIDQTSAFDVSTLARRLPTLLNQAIEDKLSRAARSFEQAAREASNRLQSAYPTVSVGETGTIALRTSQGLEFVAGSAGGLAVAATGAGLAIAGSAAAAGIAAANAAALAATTTVVAPSIASTLLVSLGLGSIAPLATGTATVAAPAALAATPLWVALAGPIGWTLASIGVMAVPFAWRLSKLKLKDKLDEASQEQIRLVFDRLKTERVPALRNMGKSIVEEFQIRLDRELQQIEAAIVAARDNRPSEVEAERLRNLAARLRSLLDRRSVEQPMYQEDLAPAL